jgi:hypothetical protein
MVVPNLGRDAHVYDISVFSQPLQPGSAHACSNDGFLVLASNAFRLGLCGQKWGLLYVGDAGYRP